MSKSKSNNNFKKFLRIYAGLLAIVILVVCIIVWVKLKKYQDDYDKAKNNGNPDKYATEFVEGLNYETILDYIETYGLNEEGDEAFKSEHAKYFSSLIAINAATYTRSENFKTALPIYDIYSGDVRIAVISLKSEGKNDSFGFHLWQLKDMAFDTDNLTYTDYTIKANPGDIVTCDGNVLDEATASTEEVNDEVATIAVQLGASTKSVVTYKLKDRLLTPEISATDSEYNTLTCNIDGTTYDYTGTNETMDADTNQRVLDTIDSYIMTIYNKNSFDTTATYLEYGSPAYSTIYSVLSSIAWGWTPDTVDILEQSVTDYTKYSDSVFACSYYGKIYKFEEGAEESGEEEFNYRLLFHKVNDKWLLYYFVITA